MLLDSGLTINPDSENSDFPKENLIELPLSRKFRSLAASPSNFDLDFDFSSAQAIDTVAVIAHNLSAAGTIQLRSGNGNTLTEGT